MPRGSGKRAEERAAAAAAARPTSSEDIEKYVCIIAEKAPASLQKPIVQSAPHIATVFMFIQNTIVPLVQLAYAKILGFIEIAKPYYYKYQLDDLLPALAGFVMCFFGGDFPLLIVAAETFYTTSKASVLRSLGELREEWEKGLEAHKKDEDEDADGDGTPDVKQISDAQYVQRKMFLAAKVLDPEKVKRAVGVCTQAFLVILGAIKVAFVRALALGSALGEMAKKTVHKNLTPKLVELTPPDYQKWVPFCLDYSCTILAVTLAFMLQRLISAVHSAMRGGLLFTRTVIEVANKRGFIKFNHEESNIDEAVGYALAGLGFLFQLTGHSVMFPLNFITFPVTCIETLLQCAVAFA